MSQSSKKPTGRPDAMVEAGHYLFQYSGGIGGGDCLTPLGVTGVVIELPVSKYITRNRRIIFENREFIGVRIYTDAGPPPFICLHSAGTEVPFYMALSIDGLLTPAEIIAQGVELSGPLPYEIEFLADRIPQPVQVGWTARIFIQLYWGNAGYVNQNGSLPSLNSFLISKHDYDITL